MEIDFNQPGVLRLDSVRALIASVQDDQSYQLRVSHAGKAFLSSTVGNVDIENLSFRLKIWVAGNDYVGLKASQDAAWVQRTYDCLRRNWPHPASSFIDVF